jgi:hypothetical protein
MSGGWNGSGTYQRYFSWVTDKANSINITASRMDTEDNGFAAGLSNCITRDGQGMPTASINWNAQTLTNVASIGLNADPASALQASTKQYVDYGIQKAAPQWGGTAGGTANALTVTLTPVPSSLTTGMEIAFLAAASNSSACTMQVNGLTAVNLLRNDGAALVSGDLASSLHCVARYNGTAFQLTSFVPSQVAATTGKFLFSSGAASGSSLDISVPSDAQEVEVELYNVSLVAGANLNLQFKTGGTTQTTAYNYSAINNTGTTVTGASATSGSNWPIGSSLPTSNGASFTLKVSGIQSGNYKNLFCMYNNSTTTITSTSGTNTSNTSLVSDLLFSLSASTFNLANYRAYKIK